MIEHLDDLLRDLLMARLPTFLPMLENVRFEPPNHTFPALVGHADGHVANVYLIDVRENRRLRSNDRRLDPVTRSWLLPPHRVDCHYLITAWSGAAPAGGIDPTVEEHKLLAAITRVLLEEGELSFRRVLPAADLLKLPPEVQAAALPMSVGPGEGFHKLAEFWGTMGASTPWRPAVYLVVTVPLIHESELEPGPPVETMLVGVSADPAVLDGGESTTVIGGHILSAGRPVAGAWVVLETAAGLRLAVSYSDSDGAFVFAGHPPGDYRLVVRARGHAPQPATPIHIPAPALAGYQISLP